MMCECENCSRVEKNIHMFLRYFMYNLKYKNKSLTISTLPVNNRKFELIFAVRYVNGSCMSQ